MNPFPLLALAVLSLLATLGTGLPSFGTPLATSGAPSPERLVRSSAPAPSSAALSGRWVWVAVTESGQTWSGRMVLGQPLEPGGVWGRSAWCVGAGGCPAGSAAGWLGQRGDTLEVAQLERGAARGLRAQFWAQDHDGQIAVDRQSGRPTFLGLGRWNYGAGGSTAITFGMAQLEGRAEPVRVPALKAAAQAWLLESPPPVQTAALDMTEYKVREKLRELVLVGSLERGG